MGGGRGGPGKGKGRGRGGAGDPMEGRREGQSEGTGRGGGVEAGGREGVGVGRVWERHGVSARYTINTLHVSDSEDDVIALLASRRRKRKRQWVHSINLKRNSLGEYHHLVQELRTDRNKFIEYFRLSPEQFDNLVNILSPHI